MSATGTIEVRLDEQTVDRLADRIAERLGNATPAEYDERMLTAAQVARRWGFDRSWVYQHSTQLGARRPGTGRRPRLRFDPDTVERAVAVMEGRPVRAAGRRDHGR